MQKLMAFLDGEDGAVTVDWIVLTAALVGLALMVVSIISGGVMNAADRIAHVMGSHTHL